MKLISPEEHERRYSHFNHELEIEKPKTDWIPTLVGVVVMIVFCWLVFTVTNFGVIIHLLK